MAYANSYVVKAPGKPNLIACLGTYSSMMPMGARECSMIHPGSLVLVYVTDFYLATIVAVLSTPMGAPNLSFPDSVVAAGHAGFFTDAVHNGPLARPAGSGYLDLSCGRPVDGLPGDWGVLNEIGVGIYVGKLMAFLRASDFCKFEVHYEDQLASCLLYTSDAADE